MTSHRRLTEMQNSLKVFFLYVIFVVFFLSLNYRHEINQRGRGLRGRGLRRREGGREGGPQGGRGKVG